MKSLRTVVAALCLAVSAVAHDYWLLPSSLRPSVGERVELRLFVGERLVVEEERPFQRDKTSRFELLNDRLLREKRPRDLAAEFTPEARPLGSFVAAEEGAWLVVMDRAPSTIELTPEKFASYLAEEGLDTIVAERKRRGEESKAGRERYRRSIKALVRASVGAGGGAVPVAKTESGGATSERVASVATTPTGQEIELVPTADPTRLTVPARLDVVARFRGKPLAGLQVAATRSLAGKTTSVTKRSDADGRVQFDLDGDGIWMLSAVHMIRGEEPSVADWESFWTSLVFAPGPPREPTKAPANSLPSGDR